MAHKISGTNKNVSFLGPFWITSLRKRRSEVSSLSQKSYTFLSSTDFVPVYQSRKSFVVSIGTFAQYIGLVFLLVVKMCSILCHFLFIANIHATSICRLSASRIWIAMFPLHNIPLPATTQFEYSVLNWKTRIFNYFKKTIQTETLSHLIFV